jgi:glucose-1-phosphate adenylyltransferase
VSNFIMGADYFEQDQQGASAGLPLLGIGKACVTDRAIIDKNARIADGVVMTPEGKRNNFDGENYFICDGIVDVPKNATIPVGFWI